MLKVKVQEFLVSAFGNRKPQQESQDGQRNSLSYSQNLKDSFQKTQNLVEKLKNLTIFTQQNKHLFNSDSLQLITPKEQQQLKMIKTLTMDITQNRDGIFGLEKMKNETKERYNDLMHLLHSDLGHGQAFLFQDSARRKLLA